MNKIIFFLSLFVSLTLFLPTSAQAACGSDSGVGLPGERCVDAADPDYEPIYPFVMCEGYDSICCSTQAECPPPPTPEPTPTTEPGTTPIPTPTITEPSTADCGNYRDIYNDGSIYCVDGVEKIISPEVRCSASSNACCRNTSLCGTLPTDLLTPPPPLTYAQTTSPPIPTWDQCGLVPEDERETCKNCIKEGEGVYTALGCIQGDTGAFTTQLLVLAISIGGGIALLIMAVGVFIMATAAGNPEKMAGGQQTVVAAITGLLIIVFSVVILNLIGVEILNIPGF